MLRYIAVWLFLLLAGCNQAKMLEQFTSPEEQAIAKGYIDTLQQHRFDEIEAALDPSLAAPDTQQMLSAMAAFIPPSQPSSITLVGAQTFKSADYSTVNLTYEYNFSGKWLVANVAVKRKGEVRTIIGLNVYPQTASLEEQYKFSLFGKSLGQYAVLTLAILFPLVTLFALVVCVKTKLKGRKWPWIIFILVGFGHLAVNWTTGQWAFNPFAFQLFSASASAPLYSPVTLAVSVPVGALLFLLLRKRLQAEVTGS